jgi:hypothetical protein
MVGEVGVSRLACMLYALLQGLLWFSLPFKHDNHLSSSLVRHAGHPRWATHTRRSHTWWRELHTARRGASRWALRRESRRKALWKRRHTWRHTFKRSQLANFSRIARFGGTYLKGNLTYQAAEQSLVEGLEGAAAYLDRVSTRVPATFTWYNSTYQQGIRAAYHPEA